MNQDSDGTVEVVVEIPRGSRNEYEATDDGTIWFDRRLGGPVGFPGDYGYVVGYQAEDGDALLGSYLFGVGDDNETRLICVPSADHHQDHLRDLSDLPHNALLEHRDRERTLELVQRMGG